jgi:thiol-disulfide isomerase/thioredoxin
VGPAILALGGALVVAAVIAIVATIGADDDQQTTSAARVTVTGQALPAFAEGDDPAVGLSAPSLGGEDFGGNPVTIGDDGRPKALIFLAHWCPHCQREVPLIQDWLDAQGGPQGVDLYSVATSIDPSLPNYPPDAWLEREGWTVPVLVDDAGDGAATAYGLSAFPYFVFVDAEGNVVARASGELTIDQLEGYLAETST